MNKEDIIEFTLEKYMRFKKRYHEAVGKGEKEFIFEEKEVLTAYAKYLLEYLKSKFN